MNLIIVGDSSGIFLIPSKIISGPNKRWAADRRPTQDRDVSQFIYWLVRELLQEFLLSGTL